MLRGLWLLAAVDPMDQLDELDARARSSFRLDATDTFLVLGAALIVVGLLFFWAFFLRRRPNEKHGVPSLAAYPSGRIKHRRRPSSRRAPGTDHEPSVATPAQSSISSSEHSHSERRGVRRRSSRKRSSIGDADVVRAEPPKKVRVRKRRRQHPENYPRNPTLGETGGLPPVRPEDPEPESEGPSEKTSG